MDAETLHQQGRNKPTTMINTEEIEPPTDLLIEILVRLPPKSIFRFMSVSKRWMRIIKSPIFLQTFTSRRRCCSDRRLLAFFQKSSGKRRRSTDKYRTNILPIKNHGNVIKHFPRTSGCFINSSDGLILCSRDPDEPRPLYSVVNPITGKSTVLPRPPPLRYPIRSAGIMCAENAAELAADYTVVRASKRSDPDPDDPFLDPDLDDNTLYIQKYSSRTGEWAESTLVATGNFSLQNRPPVIANGVFHWHFISFPKSGIAVYDPEYGENHLQLIHTNSATKNSLQVVAHDITRSADDNLWLGATSIHDGTLLISKLPKGEHGNYWRKTSIGEEEWVVIYSVKIWQIEIGRMMFLDLLPWQSMVVAVMRKDEELVLYHFEEGKIEAIEFPGDCCEDSDSLLQPYLEPNSLSSYAL